MPEKGPFSLRVALGERIQMPKDSSETSSEACGSARCRLELSRQRSGGRWKLS